MNTVICTLFEGQYHYGVSVLSNSLYKHGFRGTIYAGYVGELPKWVLLGKIESIGKWSKTIVLDFNLGLKIVFIPLETSYCLANYKPNFMLDLWEGPEEGADALFYFDPDIIVNEDWSCFEHWVNCGVALCEDVNSPLQEFHPRRVGWRNYFKKYNVDLKFKNQIYVNAGFIGLVKKDIYFLKLWIQLQEYMADVIGGLEVSVFLNKSDNYNEILKMDGFQIFDTPDQDALNAVIELYNSNVSYMGKEGMGFDKGHITMFHALGSPKPWNTKIFMRTLNGYPARLVDKVYWNNASIPFVSHSKNIIRLKKTMILFSSIIGRFYKA